MNHKGGSNQIPDSNCINSMDEHRWTRNKSIGSSPGRKSGSRTSWNDWIPAFAGMTNSIGFRLFTRWSALMVSQKIHLLRRALSSSLQRTCKCASFLSFCAPGICSFLRFHQSCANGGNHNFNRNIADENLKVNFGVGLESIYECGMLQNNSSGSGVPDWNAFDASWKKIIRINIENIIILNSYN